MHTQGICSLSPSGKMVLILKILCLSQVYTVEVSMCICISVMGWIFISLTICMLIPWQPVSCYLEMGFVEVIRVRLNHESEAFMIGLVALWEQDERFLFPSRVHWEKVKWAHSEKATVCKSGRKLVPELDYAITWSQTSSLQNCEKHISVV